MTNKDFNEQIVEPTIAKIKNIFVTKGSDYAGDKDRLFNFKDTGKKYGITPFQALAIYRDKHTRVIEKFLRGEDIKGEPVEEKILDEIAYDLLLLGLLREGKPNKVKPVPQVPELPPEPADEEIKMPVGAFKCNVKNCIIPVAHKHDGDKIKVQ